MTDDQHTSRNSVKDDILKNADLCVSCGMCLPHCPTYQLSWQEAESPRGRLSLISAYFNGDLKMDNVLRQHLDHCLLCRSCESVCPASVPFAHIMDSARANIKDSKKPQSWLKKLLLRFVSNKKQAKTLVAIINRLRIRGLLQIISFKRFAILERYIQFARKMEVAPAWQEFYPAHGKNKYTVGLFLGCVNEFFDNNSISDTIKVLNHLGVSVYVPLDQQCCGALHLHAGEIRVASLLYEQNIKAFEKYDIETVLSLSTACTATMVEQANSLLNLSGSKGMQEHSGINVTDICTFLESIHWHSGSNLKTLNSEVLLHYPCTQRNVLKNTETVYEMISRIPGLTIKEFKDATCCGAAGSYTLDYPEWSDKLKNLAANSIELQTGIIVTSNIGCMLQFRDICHNMDNSRVLHPINLVASSLGCTYEKC